jgi:magnesium transporter
MMHVYAARGGALQRLDVEGAARLPEDGVWIDLLEPTAAEERRLEGWLGLDVPTREEMQEIEASSRAYEERGALFMTALVVWRAETHEPANTPATFIVTPRHLVTVRYADPLPFRTFVARCTKQPRTVLSSDSAFVALLEAVVDRAADLLERIGGDLDAVSAEIFRREKPYPAGRQRFGRQRFGRAKSADLEQIITRVGQHNDLAQKIRESLLSVARLVSFFREAGHLATDGVRSHLKTLDRDIRSLTEHDAYLAAKISFLLDATLGLINIQQNAIIKIFSVVAVVFMPPTLVASIYGMNFHHMPELDWPFGYPMALGIMLASAVLPYLYFKFRNWL